MKGRATVVTNLYIGVTHASTKFNIRSFPDIGNSPDAIEVTDFDDSTVHNVAGVSTSDSIQFTANYLPETFQQLTDLFENGEVHFALKFGADGEDGNFEWVGFGTVSLNGADVNTAREMTIISYPTEDIEDMSESYIIPGTEVSSTASGSVIKMKPNSHGQTWKLVDENGQIIGSV